VNSADQINVAFPGVHTGKPDCMCRPCRKARRHPARTVETDWCRVFDTTTPVSALDRNGRCASCASQAVLFAKKPYQRARRWAQ
jgi:hypothetical protein